MIELNEVTKTYRSGENAVHALRDVTLRIGAGEYVALVGASGSGKSTLLHVLGCLDTPSAGTYRLDGEDVSSCDTNQLAAIRNRKIGFVFQRFHLLPRATALENVAVPLRFAGVATGARRERAAKLLSQVGLADRLDHRPSELSGGQQQRVAVARALANDPKLILADEPTGNLDSTAGAEIVALLEECAGSGATLIVVTHDEELADRAQRIIRLADGRVVEDSPPG